MTVQRQSPMELVQQLFVKLGARYVIAIGPDGNCEWLSDLGDRRELNEINADDGVITKNHWLALLSESHV